MGMEYAAIQFVQEKTPEVPVLRVFEYYVDEKAYQSYFLISSIPGEDLNKAWKALSNDQKNEIVEQVVKYINTL